MTGGPRSIGALRAAENTDPLEKIFREIVSRSVAIIAEAGYGRLRQSDGMSYGR
jgi:hypothetical protein